MSQESRSPASDAPEPRRSAFEPAVGGQEKLDFNRNLKEGKEGFRVAAGSSPSLPLNLSLFLQSCGMGCSPGLSSPSPCSPDSGAGRRGQ